MKKIGIFVGVEYFRYSSKELSREGLIRLTSILINYMSKLDDVKPVILCSKVSEKVLSETFADLNNVNQLEFLTTSNTPPLFLNMQRSQFGKKKKVNWLSRFIIRVDNKVKKARNVLVVKLLNSLWFLIGSVLLLLIMLLLVVVLTINYPVYLSWIIFTLILSYIMLKCAKTINSLFMKLAVRIKAKFVGNSVAFKLYSKVRDIHVADLVRIANKSDLDFIFVPVAFYPEVAKITKPMVVTVPDLVVCDYPQFFAQIKGNNWVYTITRMKQLIINNKYFISYSNFVANTNIHPLSGSNAVVKVIPHGNLSLKNEIFRNFDDSTRAYAIALLHGYVKTAGNSYVKYCNFSQIKYLVYTSQNRPHKNITNLLKAYNVLLRQKFCNIKLIITGSFEHTPSVAEYITKHNLQYDVLSLPNLSNKELAALDHLAHLAVNPTLFEGGFPFTFNEAYSVGTPSLMSKIPVVLEVIEDQSLQDTMLFDPYDVDDMVEKIYWGIHHRDELLEMQKPLYDKLAARSWEVVAKEYIDYFQEIMDAHNN